MIEVNIQAAIDNPVQAPNSGAIARIRVFR